MRFVIRRHLGPFRSTPSSGSHVNALNSEGGNVFSIAAGHRKTDALALKEAFILAAMSLTTPTIPLPYMRGDKEEKQIEF